MRRANLFFVMVISLASFVFGQGQNTNSGSSPYKPVLTYDPSRDAAQDILDAQAEAKDPAKTF